MNNSNVFVQNANSGISNTNNPTLTSNIGISNPNAYNYSTPSQN